MKKLFAVLMIAAMTALLAACSLGGVTRKTTTATEAPLATVNPTAEATEAPSPSPEVTTEAASETDAPAN